MRAKVESEIEKHNSEGIIAPTNWSEGQWLPMPDGSVRLCGDYNFTVNPAINVDKYPLHTTEVIP